MGKENDAMLNFLENNRRFADLFNGGLFAGESVVDATELQEADRKRIDRQGGDRARDVKKRLSSGTELIVLAVEHQSKVNYAMPWRCFNYDALDYQRQMKAITSKNKKDDNHTSGTEYIGRFRKTDRLAPVYTICLYLGEEPWDSPRSLREMMDFGTSENADRWAELFSDYEMKLICVNELENIDVFTSELKELFAIMSYRNDKQGMKAFLKEHEEYQNIDEDTAEAIGAVMGMKDFIKNKEKFKNGEGYDMCTAIREMWEDGRSEGIALGRSEGLSEGIALGRSEGVQTGFDLCATIYHRIISGTTDNEAIATECGCTVEQVEWVRKNFGQ